MIHCIVLAAGAGRRMHRPDNKVFLRLGDHSVLQWDLLHLTKVPDLKTVIVVAAAGEEAKVQQEIDALKDSLGSLPWTPVIVQGGAERQDSVYCGTGALPKAVDEAHEVVLIHDGARPMASADLFEQVAQAAMTEGAAVAAVPAVDTIKRVDDKGFVTCTLQRSELYAVQTPQGLRRDVMVKAQQHAKETGYMGTDDVSLVEHLGLPVKVVISDYTNCKLTTPEDIIRAKHYLGVTRMMPRVGFGYDVHRFKEGRPCVLGGVTIDSPIGPDGHSDADVLIHALMDALLGAAGMKDIGYWFPPEDDTFKGISSMELLRRVNLLLKERGFSAYNVDVMVIAEAPKLKPHIDAMKANIADVLDIPVDRISVKATTHEGVGAFGRREGLAAQAVVTICEGEDL